MPETLPGAVLDRATLRRLIAEPAAGQPPLIENLLCPAEQVQPNGVDLSLQSVVRVTGGGRMGRDSADRELAATESLDFDREGWLPLPPGAYLIAFREVVNLPLDLMALGRARSSLLRSGVSIHTAVWDAGYRGRSQALLRVHLPAGYALQQGARLMQLVFFRLTAPVEQGYAGRYQGENL